MSGDQDLSRTSIDHGDAHGDGFGVRRFGIEALMSVERLVIVC